MFIWDMDGKGWLYLYLEWSWEEEVWSSQKRREEAGVSFQRSLLT